MDKQNRAALRARLASLEADIAHQIMLNNLARLEAEAGERRIAALTAERERLRAEVEIPKKNPPPGARRNKRANE